MRLPGHVAVRRLADETVLLNLATGEYHGLDSTGTAFLDALQRSPHVDHAVDELMPLYPIDRGRLRHDLRDFCTKLVDRGLLELADDERG
jgi:hypothetical protein